MPGKRKLFITIIVISLSLNIAAGIYFGNKIIRKNLYTGSSIVVDNEYASLAVIDSIAPDKGISKTNILNTLAGYGGFHSYLEIGQGYARDNFDHIGCQVRIGVDPDPACKAAWCMTSDSFFVLNKMTFDLIFIDGLHHSDQVYRDIINSLAILKEGGIIVVHDCDPENEAMQVVPRQQSIWTGDVWKAWVRLRSERDDLEMFVVKNGNGCGIIRRGNQEKIIIDHELNYRYLDENRDRLLNYRSVNQFMRWSRSIKPEVPEHAPVK